MINVKEGSEKAGLILNIQKTKIMVSSPIISWKIDGETMETVTDFIFLGFKVTGDSDYSREIKRHWLLCRKAMTNPEEYQKAEISVCHHSQSYGFSSSYVRCGSSTIKKAECRRINIIKLWCWRRFLSVPLQGDQAS